MNSIIGIGLFITFAFPAGLYSQSLGEFARQERARKTATATRTITNETIKSLPASPGGAPKVAVPQPPTDSTAPAAPKDNQGRDEKWWRGAFAQARLELKRAEDRIRVLQLQLNRVHLDYLQKTDLYNREQRLAAEIDALNKDMDIERKKAEQAQEKIAQLEEELRRSGGLPTWSR